LNPNLTIVRILVLVLVSVVAAADELQDRMATVGPGEFQSVIPESEKGKAIDVPVFLLDRRPVTNRDFLDFTNANPEWQRGNAVRLFVDASYLSHWATAVELGPDVASEQPVINVSWFAATAYCEALGARLPRWYEWEFAAAADATHVDARDDPLWRQQILSWYATPGSNPLSPVGQRAANFYGVHDLHGLVWEWVDDYNALLVSADNREQGGADKIKFCGAGAISMERKEDYAVLMRVAMLSSLAAAYTTRNLGFRCAADI
jgi:formylglycine-generating enzyme required for sulfatase activity